MNAKHELKKNPCQDSESSDPYMNLQALQNEASALHRRGSLVTKWLHISCCQSFRVRRWKRRCAPLHGSVTVVVVVPIHAMKAYGGSRRKLCSF